MPDPGARKKPAHARPSQFQPQEVQTSASRQQNISEEAERFLIVCEGKETEPNYFKGFRVLGNILDIEGTGKNPRRLVDKAIRLKNEAKSAYDQIWCVFDRDSVPVDDFSGAISEAKTAGFHVAYTNVAFELWYLLHFEDHRSDLCREQYSPKLSHHLRHKYEKKSPSMYDKLQSKQKEAIRRAESLLAKYGTDHIPHQDNPCTTVHLLVKAFLANATPRPNVP